MKLYYSPGACSLAPMILADWLRLSLDTERVNPRDPSPEWLAINPLGAVPAIKLDSGHVFTQVDAILQYLCALRPGSGLDIADDELGHFEVHRWIAFLTGDFHPPFGVWFNPPRWTKDHSEASLAAVKAAAAERIGRVSRLLDEQVGNSNHIVQDRRTLLDAYAYSMVRWLKNLEGGLEAYPNLHRFMQKMSEDEGVKRALAKESA